ncbi:hypothetical protein NRY68_15160 [Acidithiobacillus ferrooxidans]|uniref:hypothetical protein n=1 Tax=Acidithiobacillus ferrooxidans TaxID=920 RepID=UPI002148EE3B|nr:hypothetical protein [Acidithiobacillus ferrooxidans]MCR1347098.1 hypothetical protein [Acidithiobacillus ferrooxidans]MCR1356621.1 hypothetical protein [Acidithiobacillus ferrooxidans]MDA8152296.1 hypothetical protein [Acidithiobacillus sp.]
MTLIDGQTMTLIHIRHYKGHFHPESPSTTLFSPSVHLKSPVKLAAVTPPQLYQATLTES